MTSRLTTFEAYLQAFVHDERQHVILGRQLKPFCLRHWLLLSAHKSPLLEVGATKTRQDMQMAIVICSTGSDAEFFQITTRPTWREKLWFARSFHHSVDEVLGQFNFYIQDYFPSFPFWESDNEPDERVPGFFVCAARLLPSVGRDAALNMPLGELIGWGMALHEAAGKKVETLMTQRDAEALKEAGI